MFAAQAATAGRAHVVGGDVGRAHAPVRRHLDGDGHVAAQRRVARRGRCCSSAAPGRREPAAPARARAGTCRCTWPRSLRPARRRCAGPAVRPRASPRAEGAAGCRRAWGWAGAAPSAVRLGTVGTGARGRVAVRQASPREDAARGRAAGRRPRWRTWRCRPTGEPRRGGDLRGGLIRKWAPRRRTRGGAEYSGFVERERRVAVAPGLRALQARRPPAAGCAPRARGRRARSGGEQARRDQVGEDARQPRRSRPAPTGDRRGRGRTDRREPGVARHRARRTRGPGRGPPCRARPRWPASPRGPRGTTRRGPPGPRPRERASSASAPVPRRGRAPAPPRRRPPRPRIPKSASRTRSEVGRVACPRGARRARDRSVPPVMRILVVVAQARTLVPSSR